MVYCTKCGTLNANDATVCSNCGAPLQTARAEAGPYKTGWRWEGEYYRYRRRGLYPLVFIGSIIAIIGFISLIANAYDINIPWGPIILIFIGLIIIIAGARARRMWSRRQ
jgi:hypothetical protein